MSGGRIHFAGLEPGSLLEATGLPPRVRAALRGAGVRTLGDLAAQAEGAVAGLSGVAGKEEEAALAERAGHLARRALAGEESGLTVVEWLGAVLTARQVQAVVSRYALEEATTGTALHMKRLGRVGERLGVTRERARQLLNLSYEALRAPLSRYAVRPVLDAVRALLQAAGGGMDAVTLAGIHREEWGGYSPVGVAVLLSEICPEEVLLYRGFFTLFSADGVEGAETWLREKLTAAGGWRRLDTLAAGLPAVLCSEGVTSAVAVLGLLARHCPDLLATLDGRAGLAARDIPGLLYECLAGGEKSLAALTTAFNAGLYPESRRGTGVVRAALAGDARVRRPAPGRYALPGGLQLGLPRVED